MPPEATVAVTGTLAAGNADGSAVEPTLEAMQKLSSLVTCGGEPCTAKGSPNAPVTLIEVSDFTCAHCADFNRDSEPVIAAKYVDQGKMRLVAHVFAFNDVSRQIAAAALCAHEQDGYFAFQREAFDSIGTEAPDRADYMEWAAAIGLDLEPFGACVDEQRHLAQVEASTQQALDAGIAATPSFVLNGLLTEGNPDLAEYSQLIETAMEAAGESS